MLTSFYVAVVYITTIECFECFCLFRHYCSSPFTFIFGSICLDLLFYRFFSSMLNISLPLVLIVFDTHPYLAVS
uniref:Putative secreted peptide n=1 Tax=Anopheles braziliensis TaxID=58242 RepID=A0A2M3ZR01_9DIPT